MFHCRKEQLNELVKNVIPQIESEQFKQHSLEWIKFESKVKSLLETGNWLSDLSIDSNINLLLTGPMLSDIGSMFMSIDEIEKFKHKNYNDKLINFIIFIMRKFVSSNNLYFISLILL